MTAIEVRRPSWTPWRQRMHGWGRMERDMEEMMERLSRGWPALRAESDILGWAPDVDLVDRNGEVILRADLPGLTEQDVKVTLQDGSLTIQGERKQEKEEKEDNFYCCERSYGAFSRSIPVPAGINADKINAIFRNGVLEVHLPKSKESSGKQIEVKGS